MTSNKIKIKLSDECLRQSKYLVDNLKSDIKLNKIDDMGLLERIKKFMEVTDMNYKFDQTSLEFTESIMKNNQFISDEIKNYVESNKPTGRKINNDFVSLKLYEFDDKFSEEDLQKILHICKIMSMLGNNIKIDLTIIPTPLKKQITEKCYGPNNVNSGSCYRGYSVIIWRREELYKVLFHELIHYISLDYNPEPDDIIYQYMKKYNIQGKDSHNEAYTDSIAILFHTIWVSHKCNMNIRELFGLEVLWGMYQVAKILKHNNIDRFEKVGNLCQYTSVFSYYISKNAMLYNINVFLDYIKGGLVIRNKEKYLKILDLSLNNAKYIENINKILGIIKFDESMRMSVLDIKL